MERLTTPLDRQKAAVTALQGIYLATSHKRLLQVIAA
jgi:hypothetical protein